MEKLDFIDSKFRLAILAAKRAKQLVGGSRKKLDSDAENPLTVALEEIYDGKINFQILEEGDITGEDESVSLNLDGDEDELLLGLGGDNPEDFLYDENDAEENDEDEEDAEDEEKGEKDNQEEAG